MEEEGTSIKLVLVGDGIVGKTSILHSFVSNKFPEVYDPTVFDNQVTTIKVDGNIINLSLWDTAGQEEFSRLRTLAYGGADAFFIVFSIIDSDSYTNTYNKWLPELDANNSPALKFIIGNKIDLRGNFEGSKQPIISKQTARLKIQQELGLHYLECSALTRQGLKQAFQTAIRQVIRRRTERRSLRNSASKDEKKVDRGCQCEVM